MKFLDRHDELSRLDRALRHPGAFAAIWGRRRVGKSRLLIEWSGRNDGLYAVAEQSAPVVQRRFLAGAIAERFPGFADVEYPTWRALLARLSAEADTRGWKGPLVLDEFPYLIASDEGLVGTLQNWLDRPERALRTVICGSSVRMMHVALLNAASPLYGRAAEAFAVRPLRPGHIADAFPSLDLRAQLTIYAIWGGMPRYWELAAPFGTDIDGSVDSLVLDPAGPLHGEPSRLLEEETPPATALRPLLDVMGAGAHRLTEIAGSLGRPAPSLSRPLAALTEMGLVRREIPFGSDPRSGKRSLYRIDDPFLRLWFRVVAPHRSALAESPPETRLRYWHRYRPALESHAWEELSRMSVPWLHRCEGPLAALGPFEQARRYWRGSSPELDVVSRSVDGKRLLVGESKLSGARGWSSSLGDQAIADALPEERGRQVVRALFTPSAANVGERDGSVMVVDARTVMAALR